MGEVQLVTVILGQFISLVLVIYLLPQQLDMLVEIEAKRCHFWHKINLLTTQEVLTASAQTLLDTCIYGIAVGKHYCSGRCGVRCSEEKGEMKGNWV